MPGEHDDLRCHNRARHGLQVFAAPYTNPASPSEGLVEPTESAQKPNPRLGVSVNGDACAGKRPVSASRSSREQELESFNMLRQVRFQARRARRGCSKHHRQFRAILKSAQPILALSPRLKNCPRSAVGAEKNGAAAQRCKQPTPIYLHATFFSCLPLLWIFHSNVYTPTGSLPHPAPQPGRLPSRSP